VLNLVGMGVEVGDSCSRRLRDLGAGQLSARFRAANPVLWIPVGRLSRRIRPNFCPIRPKRARFVPARARFVTFWVLAVESLAAIVRLPVV